MTDERETAARAFFNAAGGSYEMPAINAVVAKGAGEVAVPANPPGVSADAAETAPAPSVSNDGPDPASKFYAPVLTRGFVEWDEPAATPVQFDLQAPIGVLDRSEAGQDTMKRLREGLSDAGAGVTVARELFGDAVRAMQDRRWNVPREQAETQLRQHFGARYEAQVGAARALVQRAASKCPEIIPFLEQTGLGNSPDFVRKLAVAAGRGSRR